MARFARSESCSLDEDEDDEEEEEETEDEGYFGDFSSEDEDDDDYDSDNPATTAFVSPALNARKGEVSATAATAYSNSQSQFSMMAVVAASLRKSLVTCSPNADDVTSDVDIGWPTDVRHVSHVTFDRFDGFLGLPDELQSDVPRDPPSASASVFGVSAQSMHCSYDNRGNSVPTILLGMQSCLYSEGGLQAEGIFRINAANSQEENVRDQLNKGVVPHGIDVHCLSGLIKAWFRELPSGVLDSLTPEQIVHCNTEEECAELVELLPATEAALLDWAINLMADVAQHEHDNKMNARNIAMVFAPNMTQMADPLTALIHAVQVMNFLKTLILKTLRERQELFPTSRFQECRDYFDECSSEEPVNYLSSCTLERLESDDNNHHNSSLSFRGESDLGEKYECGSGRTSSPSNRNIRTLEQNFKDEHDKMKADQEEEGILNRISLWRGMQKLRSHPVFRLSKMVKRSKDLVVFS